MSDSKVKMYQIQFRLGFCPRPRWGADSAPPDPLAGLRGLLPREGEGRKKEEEGRGREETGRGG